MNYNFEIFIYWLLFVGAQFYLCIVVIGDIEKLVSRMYDNKICQYWMNPSKVNSLTKTSKRVCSFITLIQILVLASIVLHLPAEAIVFPTPLSVPTAYVTVNGDIVQLPLGAWKKDLPKDAVVVRLEETLSPKECSVYDIQWHTSNGTGVTALSGLYSVTFKITDYAKFYHYYKTNASDVLCHELKKTVAQIIVNDVLSGTVIIPNILDTVPDSDALLQNQEQLQIKFRKSIFQVLAQKFQDKGIVPVTE